MATLRKVVQNAGFGEASVSVQQLAQIFQLPSPLSLKHLFERGAYAMDASIREKWAELGWEESALKYPTQDQQPIPGFQPSENGQAGSFVRFQYGYITKILKQGSYFIYVMDNKYLPSYIVIIKTGNIQGAGTDCDVLIKPIGFPNFDNEWEPGSAGDDFEKGDASGYSVGGGRVCWFNGIVVRLGNYDGDGPAWYLESITIKHPQTLQQWNFPCNRWLAKEKQDGATKLTLYPPNPPVPDLSYSPVGGEQPSNPGGNSGGTSPLPSDTYTFCVTAPGSGAQQQEFKIVASSPSEAKAKLIKEHLPDDSSAGWSIWPYPCIWPES
jgi:hypothetical protein